MIKDMTDIYARQAARRAAPYLYWEPKFAWTPEWITKNGRTYRVWLSFYERKKVRYRYGSYWDKRLRNKDG